MSATEELEPATPSRIRSVEGLRVVAVFLVAAWLLRIPLFQGGYIGLDVFFVLAGYFISRKLAARPPESTRDFLTDFVAFRLRRVVPVMALVIIITSGVALALYGYASADFMMSSARSAMLFFSNFFLATANSHPLLPAESTSFFQQFWSISVLEQVALLWAILFHFARRSNGESLIRRTLWIVLVGSIALSLLTTGELNYYATFTRVAAFAIGALFAVYQDQIAVPSKVVRGSASAIGLLVIGFFAITLTSHSWYPGPFGPIVALASLAVLAGLVWADDTKLARVLSFRPLAASGRYTFSFYLWLYPAIVVLNHQTRSHPSAPLRLAVLAGVVVASILSYHFIERPVQNWLDPNDDRVDKRMDYLITYRGSSLLIAVTVVFSFGLTNMAHFKPVTAFKAAPPTALQLGFPLHLDPKFYPTSSQLADYIAQSSETASKEVGNFLPGISNLRGDGNSKLFSDCQLKGNATTSGKCIFGDPKGTLTLALVGDQRAATFLAALQPIAESEHFKVILLSHDNCRNNAAYDTDPQSKAAKTCATWHASVRSRLASLRPNVIFLVSDERDPAYATLSLNEWKSGYHTYVQSLERASGTIVFINVTGWPTSPIVPRKCLGIASHQSLCAVDRTNFIATDRVQAEGDIDSAAGVHQYDMSPLFCSASYCPPIIHGVATMSRPGVVTQTYMRFITRAVHHDILPMLEPFSVLEEVGNQIF